MVEKKRVIFFTTKKMKCPAKLTIIPKINDSIYAKMLVGRNRFYVNFAIALNETSYDDWTLESSNEENHSNYCSTQVPFHSREYSQFIRENGTPHQIQEDRRKYCKMVLVKLWQDVSKKCLRKKSQNNFKSHHLI